jgi:hypothetical protein
MIYRTASSATNTTRICVVSAGDIRQILPISHQLTIAD